MKTKKFILSFAIALLVFSCSKKEEDKTTITQEEAQVNAKIDLANNDVSSIIEDQYFNINSNTVSNKNETSTLSNCAVVSRIPAFGTTLTTGTQVTKTIDFGTGCTLSNGNTLKGKIIMTFVYQPITASSIHTINYSYDNFYHNSIKIDGNRTYVITFGANLATSPTLVMNMDLTATFANGNIYRRVGSRTTEILEGYGTPSILDNVYKVTGSWTTTFPNSATISSNITTPLNVKMSCMAVNKPLLVKGIITFVRNNSTATLNYGDGSCDNLAEFTINGNTYSIVIGN